MPDKASNRQGSASATSVDFDDTALRAGINPDEISAIKQPRQTPTKQTPEPPFIWLDEFCQLPPETNWLVRGYLERNSLAAFFGDSEAGKSFLMVDLACHIAHGLPWCGKKVNQSPVLYIAGEGGSGLRRRFKAWHEYHGLPVTDNIAIRTIAAALCEPDATADLVDLMRVHLIAMRKTPGLLIVDTVNRNFGGGDENSTRDMTMFTQGLDALRTATNACIVAVHHCGHSDKGRMRAAISLHNAVDSEYLIERTGDRKDLSSLRTTLETTKCKDAGNPLSLAWDWKLQNLPWAELDDNDQPVPMSSCVLVQNTNPPQEQPKPERLPKAQRVAMDALRTALMQCGVEDKGVVSVGEDQWRDAAYEAGISQGKQSSKRQAFLRTSRELLESEKVRCHEGRFWIPKPTHTKPYKTIQSGDLSLGCREDDPYKTIHASIDAYGYVGATDNPDFGNCEPDIEANFGGDEVAQDGKEVSHGR